jgi:hypothetical protein
MSRMGVVETTLALRVPVTRTPDLAEDVALSEGRNGLAVTAHLGLAFLDHKQLVGVVTLEGDRGVGLHRHLLDTGCDLRALRLVQVGEQRHCFESCGMHHVTPWGGARAPSSPGRAGFT